MWLKSRLFTAAYFASIPLVQVPSWTVLKLSLLMPRSHCNRKRSVIVNFLPIFILPLIHVISYLFELCLPRDSITKFLLLGWDVSKSIMRHLSWEGSWHTPSPFSCSLFYPAVWNAITTILVLEKADFTLRMNLKESGLLTYSCT